MRIDVQNIEQDALLVLYEVDLSYIGGDVYRFHSGMNGLRQPQSGSAISMSHTRWRRLALRLTERGQVTGQC